MKKGYADVLEKDPTKEIPVEEKIGRTNQKLAESDRRHLQAEIHRDEEAVSASNDLSSPGDMSETKRRIEHNKMILAHDDDLTPKSDTAKDRLAARAKEIESIIVKEMPTKNEMWPKPGSSQAQQAVRKNLRFQENYDPLCREWQDIQNKLNPDDPNAQSLELIRPD